jgi:hypothetical protein
MLGVDIIKVRKMQEIIQRIDEDRDEIARRRCKTTYTPPIDDVDI